MKMSLRSKLRKILVPIIIILVGAAVMAALVTSRKAPKKEARIDPGALARVIEVRPSVTGVIVKGTGTVQPAMSVTVIPQVSGRVEQSSPSLVGGGFFNIGDTLFEIEPADYELGVQRAEAALLKAEYELAKIESQAKVARAEWTRLNGNSTEAPNPLVVYEPQLKDAEGSLKSARAALAMARLNLERTRLAAPFNSIVHSENIDPGQYVTPATGAAVLSGTDVAEIIVPLPLDELGWITVPRSAGESGSPAVVTMDIGGQVHSWQGSIVRSLGEVDPNGRMIRVVVAVADPYGRIKSGAGKKTPLFFGAFVEVGFEGKKIEKIITIPRAALREGGAVWTVGADNRLVIKKVAVLRIERDSVLLKGGLTGGDRVVITTLAGAADGMRLRPFTDESERGGK